MDTTVEIAYPSGGIGVAEGIAVNVDVAVGVSGRGTGATGSAQSTRIGRYAGDPGRAAARDQLVVCLRAGIVCG